MINFPEEYGKEIRIIINKYYQNNNLEVPLEVQNMYNANATFLKEELDLIEELNIKKIDLRYLKYFNNLKTVVIDSFPSINSSDFKTICDNCPNLENLIIKNQMDLKTIDLKGLNNLKNLSIVSNEHLYNIKGLDYINRLDSFEFYDNVSFSEVEKVIEYTLNLKNKINKVVLDALYYIDVMRNISNKLDDFDEFSTYLEENFSWSEKLGFKENVRKVYKTGKMQNAYEMSCNIVYNSVDVNNDDVLNFISLYFWMQKNIKLKENASIEECAGICEGILQKESNPQTFAKILQFLLRILKIESYDVNTTPLDNTQYYFDKDNNSYEIPADDYFILKTVTNDTVSYSDIVCDAKISQTKGEYCSDYLLLSKSEISTNHRLIGEINEKDVKYDQNIIDLKIQEAIEMLENSKVLEEQSHLNYMADIMSSKLNLEVVLQEIEEIKVKMKDGNNTLEKYTDLKNKINDLFIQADYWELMVVNLTSLAYNYEKNVLDSDLLYIKDKLNIEISNYVVDNNKKKSKQELEEEKNRIVKHVNSQKSVGLITTQECNKLMSKIDYIFSCFSRVV